MKITPKNKDEKKVKPSILAPAGNKDAFFAAISAGADAIYCGLKSFSARMAAVNFTMDELAGLTMMAHEKGILVYVALNSLIRQNELEKAGETILSLNRFVKPDALIIQDLALADLAKQTGFKGEIHLSTLANVSFPAGLKIIRRLGKKIKRVVIPRELGIDEIKAMAGACPPSVDLEVFVHGALCYAVSGRCYWSSYLGGKSGLRGRCVQPCRRFYTQNHDKKRYFSCRDLSLDVLVKVLLSVKKIRAWKIEGRKKGPHYVYYTVKAYKILRDHPNDSKARKEAIGLLEASLGRTGIHYLFLPQRPQNAVKTDYQTGSGLILGRVKGEKNAPYLVPSNMLMAGDLLRIGYEDEPGHFTMKVKRAVPKKGRLYLKKQKFALKGKPVFLVDRREKKLTGLINDLNREFEKIRLLNKISPVSFKLKNIKSGYKKTYPENMTLSRFYKKTKNINAIWIKDEIWKNISLHAISHIWWWLPPVLWPDNEDIWLGFLNEILKKKAKNFVLNSPWQISLFDNIKRLNIWAGPFCNMANSLAINKLGALGYKGAIISPELTKKDYPSLPEKCVIPLGIVISGFWPFCISRIIADELILGHPFTSPKGEKGWAQKHGSEIWVYPNWKLNIKSRQKELQKAGYKLFINMEEKLPFQIKEKNREGLWNWNLNLL